MALVGHKTIAASSPLKSSFTFHDTLKGGADGTLKYKLIDETQNRHYKRKPLVKWTEGRAVFSFFIIICGLFEVDGTVD